MLDVVSIFYDREIEAQIIQARSLGRYFADGAREAFFIYNDDADRRPPSGLADLLVREAHPVNATVLCRRQLVDMPRHHGWRTQQILKLAAARLGTSDDYMILDAKNHFVRKASAHDFVAADGRLYSDFHAARGNNATQYVNSMRYFGLDPEEFVARMPPPITPFCAPKSLSLGLMAEMCRREEKESFPDAWFNVQEEGSEFYMLSAFLVRTRGSIDAVFRKLSARVATVWESTASSDRLFDDLMTLVEGGQLPVFSVHRKAVPVLSSAQKARIGALWLRSGLMESAGEVAAMLGH